MPTPVSQNLIFSDFLVDGQSLVVFGGGGHGGSSSHRSSQTHLTINATFWTVLQVIVATEMLQWLTKVRNLENSKVIKFFSLERKRKYSTCLQLETTLSHLCHGLSALMPTLPLVSSLPPLCLLSQNKPIQCTQFNNNNQHSFETLSLHTPLLKLLPNGAWQNTTRTGFSLVGKLVSPFHLSICSLSYFYHSLRSSCQDLSEVWSPQDIPPSSYNQLWHQPNLQVWLSEMYPLLFHTNLLTTLWWNPSN